MTVSTTALGTNTAQITINGETSPANIITALDAAIVAGGWSQHDVFNPYIRVYASTNKDGITSKYIQIVIEPASMKITTSSFESWNATTHVGTNEVHNFNRSGYMGYAYANCDIIVMVNPRWLILQTFIRNQASQWSGVVEVSRDAPEDTAAAGYPCWAWVSSTQAMASQSNGYASFPRNRANQTGLSAVADGLQTPYVRMGAAATAGVGNGSILPNFLTYAWDGSKKIIHTIRPTFGYSEIHGRMYGLKATYNIGSSYNRVNIPVDSDGFFLPSGTSTEHWVLAANPNTSSSYVLSSGQAVSGSVTNTSVSIAAASRYACFAGAFIYVSTNLGIQKIDASAVTLGVPTTISGTPDSQHIIYDGSRYVYAATNSTVVRIDTLNNDATTSLALTNGVANMWFDGTSLWCAARGGRANNSIYKVDPATFTLSATIAMGATAYTTMAMCSDVSGNVYALTAESGAVLKIVSSTNAISTAYNLGVACQAGAITFNGTHLVTALTAGATQYWARTTTTGATVGSTNAAVTAASLAYSTSGRAEIGKLGSLDVCGYPAASNPAIGFTGTLNGSGGGGMITQYTGASYGTACTIMDGNRLLHVGTSSNTLSMVTLTQNLNHADELNITYGRFLLPK